MAKNNNQNESWKVLVLLLKEIAEEKSITQQQIADATGMQRSNVNRMFSLKYCPSLDNFFILSKAIKVNFLFEDKEKKIDMFP